MVRCFLWIIIFIEIIVIIMLSKKKRCSENFKKMDTRTYDLETDRPFKTKKKKWQKNRYVDLLAERKEYECKTSTQLIRELHGVE